MLPPLTGVFLPRPGELIDPNRTSLLRECVASEA